MAYTEIKTTRDKQYYYRCISVREGIKVSKKRIYLGKNLTKKQLAEAENEADFDLGILTALLSKEDLMALQKIKNKYSRQPKANLENRYEAFISLYTHNSTAIEGNTLTLQETASLIFDELAPSRKPMKDINEVLNHKKAVDFILQYDGDVTKKMICDLHELIIKDAISIDLSSQIGRFRTVPVFIRGAGFIPPGPKQVGKDMKNLLSWYTRNKSKVHPLVLAVYFHVGFEAVHPFIDGNGRVGRLLLNFILHKNGYPMVNIPNLDRNMYYDVLQEAQVNGNLRPIVKYIIDLLDKNEVML